MTFLSAIILLGIIIFVHELGHFLFAKLMGVRVLKFSLGFGPKLIGKKYGDTEYLISAIPLGGYVKMLGETEEDELKEEDNRLRIIFSRSGNGFHYFAGPLFNILFGTIVFIFIFLTGLPFNILMSESRGTLPEAGLVRSDRLGK
jgi:regulator of sigma E protease